MDRVYSSGASGSAPAIPGSPSIGYPTAGNPATATPATKPGAYWYHQVTEEIRNVITAGGIVPAGADVTQLLQSIKVLVSSTGYFYKADASTVAFTKTGANTLQVKAGTRADVFGTPIVFLAATSVVMPALTAGTDYAIYACQDGTIRADSSFSAPIGYSAANSRQVGGFHYGLVPAGTTVAGGSFATTGTGMIWTQADVDKLAGINQYSLWDLKFRPTSDPRGMVLVAGRFWADIYWCSTDTAANGTSKYNTTVASGTVLPKIPAEFGGNGTATYANGNWWTFNEIAQANGKRLPYESEFVAAAFGVTENQSLGGGLTTIPSTTRLAGYTSKYGLEQASGHIWTWGADSSTRWDGATPGWAYRDVNGGRGQLYLYADVNLVRVLLGGSRGGAAASGSRASSWSDYPWNSIWGIGLRAFGDHLKLA